MKNLKGKSVLVTGGARGIGKAVAKRFIEEGSRVMILDYDAAGAAAAAEQLGCTCVQADVADASSVQAAIEACVAVNGRLDVLVNNAGIEQRRAPIQDSNFEEWQRVLAVDLGGVYLCMKYGIGQMLRQGGGGAVVNIASIAGLVGIPMSQAYGAAKAGVANLTQSCAWEQGQQGIRVNAVAPTAVLTEMIERVIANSPDPDAQRREFESWNALPGIPLPEDVAAAVAFLASDDARFITGVVLPVDAGYTAR